MEVGCAFQDFDFDAHEENWDVAPINFWKADGVLLRRDDDLGLAFFAAVDRVDHLVEVAGEGDVLDRRQRIHHRHHVLGAQLRLDESRQRVADRYGVRAPHVVIVEEDRVNPDVLGLRLGFFIIAIADLANGRFAGLRVAVDLDRGELLDGLRLAIFEDLEIRLLQIADRLRLLVGGRRWALSA